MDVSNVVNWPQYAAERYWYVFDFLPLLEDNGDQIAISGTVVTVPAELTLLDTRVSRWAVYALVAVSGGAVLNAENLVVCDALTIGGQTLSLALTVTKVDPSYNITSQLEQEEYWHQFIFTNPLAPTGDVIVDSGTLITVPAELTLSAQYNAGTSVWGKIIPNGAALYTTPYVVKCHARTMFGQRMELYEAVVITDPAVLEA